MHRKINIFAALLIIIILAIISAWAISVKALGPSTFGIGVNILTSPIKCVLDPKPDATTCLASCPICGSIPGCVGLFEVKAQFLSGTNMLARGQAFCINSPLPPNGGSFSPGSQCLGNVSGRGPHQLQNFGCGF